MRFPLRKVFIQMTDHVVIKLKKLEFLLKYFTLSIFSIFENFISSLSYTWNILNIFYTKDHPFQLLNGIKVQI